MSKSTLRGALALGTAVLMVLPIAAPIHPAGVLPPPEFQPEFGKATWYGEQFQGLNTASGESFDMYKLTAAHRRLPLGSTVRVVNLATGKTVLVRINDRGPVAKSAMIDLSLAAAEQLGIRAQGHAQVRLDFLTRN